MSGEMQENSDIAVRLASEETRAGGMTTPVLCRAEASLRMERMVSARVTASREANNLSREVSYCSHNPRFDTERDIPDAETSNWRAVCGKTASTVRREGRREPSLPLSWEASPQSSKVASSVISALSSFDTGHPAFALATSSSNVAL